jgi:DNA invertase Pin-like site-specific DNA recombinase
VSGGRAPERRPGWREAVRMLEAGEADVVVVARLDRLTRSVLHFTQVVDALGERIVCLDPELDTTTASGRMAANIFATFGQYERDLISERTKAALG